MRGAGRLLLVLLVAVLLGRAARADDVEALRRALLEARDEAAVARALDALAARIGEDPGFGDAGEYADFLAALPPERLSHPVVALHLGWALVAAKRGAEALSVLDQAAAKGAAPATVLAYRGEALRQAGRLDEAIRSLAEAVRSGFTEPFARESATKAAFDLRPSGWDGGDLPPYAAAFEVFLAAAPEPPLHATLARWLLEDLARSWKGDPVRAKAASVAAGRHALAAIRADPELEGARSLALDAAEAMTAADGEEEGRTSRFDLLAWAVRLGAASEDRAYLRALVLLAESALFERRFPLAARLARLRLDASDSPAARRVLDALPPAYGD